MRRARERRLERESRRRRISARSRLAGAGAALGAAVVFSPVAEAATFTVTSLADDGSDGTLRHEVEDANLLDGDDLIVFQSGLSGTITHADFAPGDIDIYYDGLEIQGPGAGVITVSGDDDERIFDVYQMQAPDEQVTISGLTLTEGRAPASLGGYEGGAVRNNDFLGYSAELTIADSVLTQNSASSSGGAVASDSGSLTITGSVLSGNYVSDGNGGAVHVADTDGDQTTEVLIQNSAVTENTAYGANAGGGISLENPDGGVMIQGSTISGNTAENAGGGIYLADTGNGAAFVVDASTLSGNTVYWYGGAIAINSSDGETLIQNSTVSGNSATTGESPGGFSYGGGIYFRNADPEADPRVHNSTITQNSASGGGGIYLEAEGATISSSIVSGNAGDEGADLGQETGNGPPPADGFELGFSIIGDQGPGSITESPAGSNIFGVDPQLGPLQNNGGATQTHAPAQTSPVVDQGVANGLASDQRGLARTGDLSAIANAPGGDGTDIGAVELQAAGCQGSTLFSITGSAGDDNLSGTAGSDPIFGLAGNDVIDGLAGNDCLDGDAGKDNLKGGGGDDEIAGQSGKDKVKGGGGKDKLKGGGGKDNLKGGGGKDKLKGGPGKDKIKTGGGKDKVNCGGGKDKVNADPKDKIAANCEKVI